MSGNVLVTGDYLLDHHIYEGKRDCFADRINRGVKQKIELGGAALVHYLLQALSDKNDPKPVESHLSIEVDSERQPIVPPGPCLRDFVSAYAVWAPIDPGGDKPTGSPVWRTIAPMGFGGDGFLEAANKNPWTYSARVTSRPDVVVLSDGGMGFREGKAPWPDDALREASWIVLKTTSPLMEGELWEKLTEHWKSKLVVVMGSAALRQTQARISSGYSWDDTLDSIFGALAEGGDLSKLSKCKHLIVAFGSEGGLWVEFSHHGSEKTRAHLVYDASAIEDERKPKGEGTAFGSLSCLTASVAWQLVRNSHAPDLEEALEGGLSAIRDLQHHGHGPSSQAGAGFPAARLAKRIKGVSCDFARTLLTGEALSPLTCRLPSIPGDPPICTGIIHAALGTLGQSNPDPAWGLAERVALYGPIALGSQPHLSIGNLISADRQEIEALRVLRRLVLDYQKRPTAKKPLSLGVFGPPGAGKSFAVREIATNKDLLPNAAWMEFNLSQFKSGADDLIGAFHQIRDNVLRGKLPVAFFDEFDSRNYEWLQYLLAPMQDGAFQQGQITHPIGKCIFIFAGGTSWTFESFGPSEGDSEEYMDFKMAKGPDFKSRIDGFLNIFGPNQRQPDPKNRVNSEPVYDDCDIFYPVRRAFMIRSELSRNADDILDIDRGLLNALLKVKDYRHGARSLSKIVEPLKDSRQGTIRRSMIAPKQQLALYVDANDFLKHCQETEEPSSNPTDSLPSDWREKAASAIHNTFRLLGKEFGWLDPVNDVDFESLSDFYKGSNLAAADRVKTTLALIGLTIADGTNTEAERAEVRLALEHNLELLAEAEHAGWMAWHLEKGWEFGTQKTKVLYTENPDPAKRPWTHPSLKPYLKLSPEDRTKDRDAIRHYPESARAAGLKIVPK